MFGIGNTVAVGKMLETGQANSMQYGTWGSQAVSNVSNWHGINLGYSADHPFGLGYGYGSLTTSYPAATERMNQLGSEQKHMYGQWGNGALNTVSALYGTELPIVADHPFGQGVGYGNPTPMMGYTGMNSIGYGFMGYPTKAGVANSPALGVGERLPSYATTTFDANIAASYNPFTAHNNVYQSPVFAYNKIAVTM